MAPPVTTSAARAVSATDPVMCSQSHRGWEVMEVKAAPEAEAEALE